MNKKVTVEITKDSYTVRYSDGVNEYHETIKRDLRGGKKLISQGTKEGYQSMPTSTAILFDDLSVMAWDVHSNLKSEFINELKKRNP